MGLADDLRTQVAKTFKSNWDKRDGRVVPEPDDLLLGNDAVEFDRATVLYADLTGSTSLVDDHGWMFAAEVYKTYLHCAAKLVLSEGGSITSYDGDRIMGVFVGGNQSTSAVRCALKINYAVKEIINPSLKTQYPNTSYLVSQVVGVDTSGIRAARTGVRGGNDIVWVGRAANYAAKLTEIKLAERTWITEDLYNKLGDVAKKGGPNNESMWKSYKWSQNGDIQIYGSIWQWKFE
jgi:class 3 adenylate cyclase